LFEFLWRRWQRLRQRHPAARRESKPVTLHEEDALVARVLGTRPTLFHLLNDRLIPYWLPDCLDEDAGGYHTELQWNQERRASHPKHIISQSRTAWFFARLARSGALVEGLAHWRTDALAAAGHGVDFLRDRLWDHEADGFYWEVSHDGTEAVDPAKRSYAQGFGLYAAAEYAWVSGSSDALNLARRAERVLEDRFHDPRYGGYRREFNRTWDGPNPNRRWPPEVVKSLNDHLHVLEALAVFAVVQPDPRVTIRLQEMVLLFSSAGLRRDFGTLSDAHAANWSPLFAEGHQDCSYGHNAEGAWLLCEACAAAGLPVEMVLEGARDLIDHLLQWGWDQKRGGVYEGGPWSGPAFDREKVYWVQAETLVAALLFFRRTGDPRYAELYLRLLRWIEERQLRADGEWHVRLRQDGGTVVRDLREWRSPYHHGRALLMCLELLRPGSPCEGLL
jgi:mannobiose 2-epimerase